MSDLPLSVITPRKVFAPVGRCIYCGAASVKLTQEHIIPFGLGGNLILPEASCEICSAITGAFEQTCLRTMLGRFRIKAGLKTRRKKDRPKSVPVEFVDDDDQPLKVVDVPISEYPLGLALMEFGYPRILLGQPPSQFTTARLWHSYNQRDARRLTEKHQASGFRFAAFHPLTFAKMLAKIAHSYAVARYGLGSFTPMLPDLILGRATTGSYWIGGGSPIQSPESALHNLDCNFISKQGSDTTFLVVHMHLFAVMQAPPYLAVAGTLPPSDPISSASAIMHNR